MSPRYSTNLAYLQWSSQIASAACTARNRTRTAAYWVHLFVCRSSPVPLATLSALVVVFGSRISNNFSLTDCWNKMLHGSARRVEGNFLAQIVGKLVLHSWWNWAHNFGPQSWQGPMFTRMSCDKFSNSFTQSCRKVWELRSSFTVGLPLFLQNNSS